VPLSRNLVALTYWKILGHSRPVTGLHYLYLLQCIYKVQDYSQDLQILQTLDRSLVDARQFVVVKLPAKRDTGVNWNKVQSQNPKTTKETFLKHFTVRLVRLPIQATYRGADKSLARPWKETSYSDQDLQYYTKSYGVQTTAIYCCCLQAKVGLRQMISETTLTFWRRNYFFKF